MRRLLQPKNRLVSTDPRKSSCYLSALNIIQGEVDPLEVHKSLIRIKERNLVNFAPWGQSSMQVSLAPHSPYVDPPTKISGLLLANHTSISTFIKRTSDQYDRLRKRNAFLDQYKKMDLFKDGFEEFDESREIVQNLIDEYKSTEKENFLDTVEYIDSHPEERPSAIGGLASF